MNEDMMKKDLILYHTKGEVWATGDNVCFHRDYLNIIPIARVKTERGGAIGEIVEIIKTNETILVYVDWGDDDEDTPDLVNIINLEKLK